MDCNVDLISKLPVHILHQIQMRLHVAEFYRTAVLSKYWNFAHKSNPAFCFDQKEFMKRIDKDTPDHQDRVEEFLSVVDSSLQTFTQSGLRIQSLILSLHSIQAHSISRINAWLPFALSNGIFRLLFGAILHPAHQSIAYPLSETVFSINSNAGSSKFFNLQYLALFEVIASEKIIRDITENCPNITKLMFWHIYGSKSIEISKLHKLEHLEILLVPETERIFVDAPSLLHFRCQYFVPGASDLSSCHALKYLEVNNSEITGDEIGVLMSRFPGLETLKLAFCQVLNKVRITHLRLKSLTISQCSKIESIFIDAPTLSQFTFEAAIVKFPHMSSNFVRGNVDVRYNLDATLRVVLDSSKFVDLRRFLENSTMLKYLTISFFGNEVCFDSKVAGEDGNPALVKVDHLELKCLYYIDETRCAALLEGVLWSCHPKIISFSINDNVEICLQKIFCKKLLRSEDRSCCNGTKSMCWHQNLKAAKIDLNGDFSLNDKSDGIEYEQFRLALDQPSIFQTNKRVRFLLDWDDGTTTVDQTAVELPKRKRKAGKPLRSWQCYSN